VADVLELTRRYFAALESGATGEALAAFYAPEAVQEEFPNRLLAHGARRDRFADRCFDLLDEYAPNFKRSVIAQQVLTPLDLERGLGLTGGNIFQGAMTLSQLFSFRPVPGFADYRTPLRGLYLCGSAAHPGGGVMDAAGWNAARAILRHR
jgi:phytoene dehydrogenase-like protein